MRLEQELLMQRFPDFTKLLSFGFVLQEDAFVYTASIGEGAFHVRIAINEKGVMDAHVTDAQTDEEYGRSGWLAGAVPMPPAFVRNISTSWRKSPVRVMIRFLIYFRSHTGQRK